MPRPFLKFAFALTLILTGCKSSLSEVGNFFSGGVVRSFAISGPPAVTAGACSRYDLTARDANGAATPAKTDMTVALSTSGQGVFYLDAACTTSITSAQLAAGATTVALYFRDTVSESLSLSASADGVPSAAAPVKVSENGPVKLLLPVGVAATAGTCTSYSVVIGDSFGNPTKPGDATVIALGASNGSAFYSDAACATGITEVTIASASSSATFYRRDTAAGTLTLVATTPALTAASANYAVGAGAGTHLHLTGPAQITAGACAALVVGLEDAYGNAAKFSSASAVALGATGAGVFSLEGGCSVVATSVNFPADSGNTTIFFKSNAAQSQSLSASAPSVTPASLALNVVAGSASRLGITGTASTVAGVCTLLTVVTEDASGNAAPAGAPVSISLSGGTFYSDAACAGTTSLASIGTGAGSVVVYFKDLVAHARTLGAAATGYSSAVLAISIGAAAPAGLTLTAPTSIGSGTCTAFTAALQDTYGNAAVTAAPLAVSLAATGSANFSSSSNCASPTFSTTIAASAGSSVFYFRDTAIESTTVTLTAAGLNPGGANVSSIAGSPVMLALLGGASQTAGVCATFTLRSEDAGGNAANLLSSTFVALGGVGAGAFYLDAGCSVSTTGVSMSAGTHDKTVYFRDTTTETLGLTAANGGALTPASTALAVSSDTPAALRLAGPATYVAAACTPITVSSIDQFGNASPGVASRAVTLGGEGSGHFYSDSSCTGLVAATTIAALASAKTVYFRDTLAESLTLSATAGGVTAGTLAISGTGTTVVQLSLSGPATLLAGVCGTYSVVSQDSYGNAADGLAPQSVALAGNALGLFYSDSGCSLSTTSSNLATGTHQKTIYYKNTTAQSVTLAANASGLTSGTYGVVVGGAGVAKVGITGAAFPTAGVCTAYTVVTQDQYANSSNVASSTLVTLGTTGAAGFYSDSGCTASISSVSVTSGTAAVAVYLKDQQSQTVTLAVSASGLSSGSLPVEVKSATPAMIVMSGPATPTAGACAPYLVATNDSFGNPSAVAGATLITLSGAAHGVFYSDVACASSVTTVTIGAASSSQAFYYRNTTAEAVTLAASGTGLSAGTLSVTLGAGAINRLTWSGATSLASGACFAYDVTSADQYSNAAVTGSPIAVTLTHGGAGGFFSDVGCATPISATTISAAASTKRVYYSDAAVESFSITGAAAGITSGTLAITSYAAAPTQFRVTGAGLPTVGTCQPYLIATIDNFGNSSAVVSDTTVALSGNALGAFYPTNTCTGAITTTTLLTGASSKTVYFSDYYAESLSLTAGAAGLTSGSLTVVTQSGAISQIVFTGRGTITAAQCAPYNLVTADSFGNSANAGAALSFALSNDGSGAFYSDSGCSSVITTTTIAAGTSLRAFYFKDSVQEGPTLSATTSGYPAATQLITVQAATATKLTMAGSATPRAGVCTAYTMTSRDAYNNSSPLASAATVTLSGNATGTFYNDSGCSVPITTALIPSGQSGQIIYFRDNLVESTTLGAAASGLTSAALAVAVGPNTPTQLAIVGSSGINDGACTAYDVVSRDAYANASDLTSLATMTLTGSGAGAFYSDAGCSATITSTTIAASAHVRTIYFRDLIAPESLTFGAATAGLTAASLAVAVTPLAPVALTLAGPTTLTNNRCSTAYTVTTKDTYGNLSAVVAPLTVNITGIGAGGHAYSDPTCATLITSLAYSVGESSHVFYFKDNVAESLTLAVGATSFSSATVGVSIPNAPTKIVFTSGATSATSGSCTRYTVTAQDAGNVAQNVAATQSMIITGTGAGLLYSDSACTTRITTVSFTGGTNNQSFYFQDPSAEVLTVTAVLSGYTSATLGVTENQITADLVLGQPDLVTVNQFITGIGTSTAWLGLGGDSFYDGTYFFFTDTGNARILIYNGLPTTMLAVPSVVVGYANLSTQVNGGLTATTTQLSQPASVTSDGTHMIVSDSAHHRVLIWNSIPTTNLKPADVVLGQSSFTGASANRNGSPAANTISSPCQVYTDGTKLYVADGGNNRVLIWNTMPTTNGQAADVVVGQAGFTTNTSGTTATTLSSPQGVVAAGGQLFIADSANHRVMQFTSVPTTNGATATYVLGQATATTGTANLGGSITSQTLNSPNRVSSDGTRLYVSDFSNRRLLIWNALPAAMQKAADVVVGQSSMTAVTSGVYTAAQFNSVTSAYSDGTKLYVTESGSNTSMRVMGFNNVPTTNGAPADFVLGQVNFTNSNGPNFGVTVSGAVVHPHGIASDGTNFFAVDNWYSRVLIWPSVPTASNTAATIAVGQPNLSGFAQAQTQSTMRFPSGIAVAGGRLFVADTSNHRVLIWNTIPTASGQLASVVLGQTNFTNANAVCAQTGMSTPVAVASDGSKLVVADTGNHRVLIWNSIPTSSTQPADIVLGQANFTNCTANAGSVVGSGGMNGETGIWTDGTRLAIVDRNNNRVLIWNTFPIANQQPPDIVLGQSTFTTSTSGPASNQFSSPYGVHCDGTRFFVSDTTNNRILVWNQFPTASAQVPNYVIGQPTFNTVNFDSPSQILTGTGLNIVSSRTTSFYSDGTHLWFADASNYRVLRYTLP